jgi:diphosphomevalonate decarboxylase
MKPENYSFTATAPSNIAFIKYWGKRDAELQWPANDSLSMTLSACKTITTVKRIDGDRDVFHFAGVTVSSDVEPSHKVFRHLQFLRKELNIARALEVESRNLFPTGCGVASSASGFAALTLATVAALTGHHEWGQLSVLGLSRERLAHLARRGSGSAGRSMFGGFVHWAAGQSADAQKIEQIAPASHWQLADIVVILSDKEKHTSSTNAHQAAWGSPLFPARLAGAPSRIEAIFSDIKEHNIESLGQEIENDALEMHAVAMTGTPQVNYFLPETTKFIAWVRSERLAGNLPAWFTIDAGPNIHLICESRNVALITAKIKSTWPKSQLIIDKIGDGPTLKQGLLSESHSEVHYV